ncbi:MAG: translocation/assembly module TamB domain-containing protein [Puniceicoccaceae bacterium]
MGILLLSPLWLAPLLKPIAARYGVEWENAEARGWSTLVLSDVRYVQPRFTVSIDELIIPQPFPWLKQRYFESPRVQTLLGETVIEIQPGTGEPKAKRQGTGFAQLDPIKDSFLEWEPWTPRITVQLIQIQTSDGMPVLVLGDVLLDGPDLSGRLRGISMLPEMELQLTLLEDAYRLQGAPLDRDDISVDLTIEPSREEKQVTGLILSSGQPMPVELDFPQGRWTPRAVRASAKAWPVPPALTDYTPWEEKALLADFGFEWADRTYNATVALSGEAGWTGFPMERVRADIAFAGDKSHLRVTQCDIETHWLEAHLSQPVGFSLVSFEFLDEGEFDLQANLSENVAIPAEGRLKANAVVHTTDRTAPELEFSITGESLLIRDVPVPFLSMEGSFLYPELVFREITVDLGRATSAVASGSYVFSSNQIQSEAAFILSPEWLTPYAPDVQFEDPIRGTIRADGTLHQLNHSGSIEPACIAIEGIHPTRVSGTWSGIHDRAVALEAQVESDGGAKARFQINAERGLEPETWTVTVSEGHLADSIHKLELEDPFSIGLSTAEGLSVDSISKVRLSGNGSHAEGIFEPARQRFSMNLGGIDLGSLDNWITRPSVPVHIEKAFVEVSALDPFLESSFSLKAQSTEEALEQLSVELEGLSGAEGLKIGNIRGSVDELPFIEGAFALPVQVRFSENKPSLEPIEGSVITGTLTAEIGKELSDQLPDVPFIGSVPVFAAKITAEGSAENPQAGVEIRLDHYNLLSSSEDPQAELSLRNLVLKADVSAESVHLQSLQANLGGATLSASGNFPSETLLDVASRRTADWKTLLEQGDLTLSLQDLQAHAFEDLLPSFLRPTGMVDGEVRRTASGWDGHVHFADFSFRPTLYSPSIDQIHLGLNLEGTALTIKRAGARMGNCDLRLSGFINLTEPTAPVFSVNLTGERAPLLRTPDLLIHGDLDLQLDGTDPESLPVLRGSLLLRDSVMLMDFDPMAARTAGEELPKPPFFSVDREPFKDWQLDVDISGNDFLRLRSPYLKALVSIQMDLSGTAGSPVWVGDLRTSEGTIDFPGLRMTVSRSDIFITRERQDTFQLDINAIGQVASYVVSMQIDETLDDPHLAFAATPDLGNTQILRLLATGSPDRSNLSSVGLFLGRGFFDPGATNSIWDRFSVEIGRDVSESSKDTLDLYYDITDRWRIHGQYDKYDAQNLNLEWEAFSR